MNSDIFETAIEVLRHNSTEVSAGITAIATGFIAWFTIVLARAGRRQIEDARIIQRAYVKMSHKSPGLMFGSDGADIIISIKNFGKTPARITGLTLKADARPNSERLPTIPDYSTDQISNFSTAFLVEDDEVFFSNTLTVADNWMSEARDGTATLRIYGFVDYIDQFNTRHRGGYGRRYIQKPGDNNLIYMDEPGYNYDRPRVCGEGNDWDNSESQYGLSKPGTLPNPLGPLA